MTRKTAIQVGVYAFVCVVILALPLFIDDDFLLNRIDRYLVLAIVSMALSLSWGYAGILNLGQAMSFGIGSYCMAMGLKLRTIPVHTGSEGLPDFMVWNNVEALPWFWKPFYSMIFTIVAGIGIPMLLAAVLAWFMFRGRVTGVYVAIIPLATLVVVNLLIIDQQWATGGFNGITDLAQFELFGITFDAYSSTTYYLIATCLTFCLFLSLAVTKSKAGLILQAIRDQESRVRFFGYDVALFKTMVFCISAGIAGLAGMLYTIVMEFASPTFLGVQLSLSIVVWCAVGGRQSLLGALLGAILVAGMQGALSESEVFLETWTLVMGALFVLVVLFLPNGIASIFDGVVRKTRLRTASERKPAVDTKAAGGS